MKGPHAIKDLVSKPKVLKIHTDDVESFASCKHEHLWRNVDPHGFVSQLRKVRAVAPRTAPAIKNSFSSNKRKKCSRHCARLRDLLKIISCPLCIAVRIFFVCVKRHLFIAPHARTSFFKVRSEQLSHKKVRTSTFRTRQNARIEFPNPLLRFLWIFGFPPDTSFLYTNMLAPTAREFRRANRRHWCSFLFLCGFCSHTMKNRMLL